MATLPIDQLFTWVDWTVLFAYLCLCTWIGHLMSGKQASIRDFFLGGRTLPWQAVSGSIIATEISGVTFIGVPGTLFALQGDFTYLQWAIGSIIARFIVAKWFVRVYYEREIYSSYDYMGARLGGGAKTLATILFFVGGILGQSVRVLVAALPLRLVTDMPIFACIAIIGVFAIGWTLMGGMRTVIWTDVLQFLLFTFGGLTALIWIVANLPGGWSEFVDIGSTFGRFRTFDWTFGLGPELEFTMWVALLAVPFQNLTVFGVDQLCAQRIFCCRDAKAAGKAISFSSLGQLLTLLMLMVGAALFVHYHHHGFNRYEAEVLWSRVETAQGEEVPPLQAMQEAPLLTSKPGPGDRPPLESNVHEPAHHDMVFPMWIVSVLPVGLSGLILAGVFAAAISSLDSILAALSQSTLSLIYNPEKEGKSTTAMEDAALVRKSRWLVVAWGLVLTLFTFILYMAREGIPILPLAFGMTSYSVGPMLAIFLAALWGRGSVRGLTIGTIFSFLLVMLVRTDVWVLVLKAFPGFAEDLAALPTYRWVGPGSIAPVFSFVWTWPVTTVITLLCGISIPAKRIASSSTAHAR